MVTIAIRAARRATDPSVGRAWWLFAGSFLAYALGDLAWFLIEIVLGQEVPAPSAADLGYLAFYPLLVLGLLALPRERRTDRTHLLDLAIVCTACAAAIWWLVVGPVAATSGSDLAATLVAVAYPVGDLLILFALAAAILGHVRGVPGSVLLLLGAGIVCNTIADLAYARLSLQAEYTSGAWLDVAYMLGWLALGGAGILQLRAPVAQAHTTPTGLRRPTSALPYVATIGLFLLVGMAVAPGEFDTQVLIAGAIGVTALVSVRQLLTARQNARLMERQLQSETRYAEILRNATDAVVVVGRDGVITYATPSAVALAPAGAILVGLSAMALVRSMDAPLLAELLQTAAERPEVSRSVACRSAGEVPRDLEVETANLLANPLVGGIVVTLRDVTERRRFETELRSLALHDPLTGLANRVLFGDRLEQALARSQRRRTRPSVLFLDLDGFKTVNDTLGHTAGDEVLVEVARRLREVVRDEDTAARLGGDEFGVLIEDTIDEAAAVRVAERIERTLDAPMTIAGKQFQVAASVGIVRSHARDDDKVTLLRNADIAMYEAKRETPGRHQVFTARMYEHTVDRVGLETDLRTALDGGQLEVVYQPLVDLAGDRMLGVEALLRWHHPERGLIEPTTFIPIAESSGEIGRIGLWVLEEACRTVGGWNDLPRATAPCQRQRVREAAGPALRRCRRRCPAPDRLPARAAGPGAHRIGLRRGVRAARGGAPPAAREGRAHLDRRLRHRLLVTGLPARPARGRAEDRPLVHRGHGHPRRAGAGRHDHPDGARPVRSTRSPRASSRQISSRCCGAWAATSGRAICWADHAPPCSRRVPRGCRPCCRNRSPPERSPRGPQPVGMMSSLSGRAVMHPSGPWLLKPGGRSREGARCVRSSGSRRVSRSPPRRACSCDRSPVVDWSASSWRRPSRTCASPPRSGVRWCARWRGRCSWGFARSRARSRRSRDTWRGWRMTPPRPGPRTREPRRRPADLSAGGRRRCRDAGRPGSRGRAGAHEHGALTVRRFFVQFLIAAASIALVATVLSLLHVTVDGVRVPVIDLGTQPIVWVLSFALMLAAANTVIRPVLLLLTGRWLIRSFGLALLVIDTVVLLIAGWLDPRTVAIAEPRWVWILVIAVFDHRPHQHPRGRAGGGPPADRRERPPARDLAPARPPAHAPPLRDRREPAADAGVRHHQHLRLRHRAGGRARSPACVPGWAASCGPPTRGSRA